MDQFITVIVAVIILIISAYVTHYFTRKLQLEVEWRKDKLLYYSQLIDSTTEIISMPKDTPKAYTQFAHACNVVSLIAPQDVANILFEFYRVIQSRWEQESTAEPEDKLVSDQKRRLQQLVWVMRKDLGIETKDDPETLKYKIRSSIITE